MDNAISMAGAAPIVSLNESIYPTSSDPILQIYALADFATPANTYQKVSVANEDKSL